MNVERIVWSWRALPRGPSRGRCSPTYLVGKLWAPSWLFPSNPPHSHTPPCSHEDSVWFGLVLMTFSFFFFYIYYIWTVQFNNSLRKELLLPEITAPLTGFWNRSHTSWTGFIFTSQYIVLLTYFLKKIALLKNLYDAMQASACSNVHRPRYVGFALLCNGCDAPAALPGCL